MESPLLNGLLNPRFSPIDLPNLSLWLDATDPATIALSGSSVTQWSDKSGNANHATQGTAVRQPKYVASAISGRPAVQGRHDSVNASQLDVADNASLNYTNFTAFTVFQRVVDMGAAETLSAKYTTTGNQREWWQQLGGADNATTIISSDGTSTGVGVALVSVGISLSVPKVFMSRYDGVNVTARLGDEETVQTAYGAGIFNGTSKLTLFSRPDFADTFAGYIGEHLFYTRALSASQQAAVIAYLKNKWGIV